VIEWSDTGIVISLAKQSEKYRIVNIFTENHGNVSGMVSLSHDNKMAVFSRVNVVYRSKTESSIGFWRKKDERQVWIYFMNSQAHLLICQSICYLLNRVLPQNLQYRKLFKFIDEVSCSLHTLSTVESLGLYAYFELLLLSTIGFGIDLKVCGICGKAEVLTHILLDTCRGVSERCAANVQPDGLLQIPYCWKDWSETVDAMSVCKVSQSEIRKSLEITGLFLRRHTGIDCNHFRSSITKLV
jgi:DNA repair protein RecO (recombination protein O)